MVCGDSNMRRGMGRGGATITRRGWQGGKVEEGVAISKGD